MVEGLVAAYWTLAGAPIGEAARWSFESRVRAAAEAGFTGIGLHHDDYIAMRARGVTDAELRRVLEVHGIAVDEIEFVSGWSSDDAGMRAKAREAEDTLYALADAAGASQLNVGCSEPADNPVPLERMAERFAGVCERAAEHGLVVAIEFMPWTGIPDVRRANEVVEASGASNGGILFDTWHFVRGGADYDALRAVPPKRILGLQINDGPAVPVGELRHETRHGRRLPGEGDFPLHKVIAVLREIGVQAPWSVEVMSALQASLPVDVAARHAFESTRRVLLGA